MLSKFGLGNLRNRKKLFLFVLITLVVAVSCLIIKMTYHNYCLRGISCDGYLVRNKCVGIYGRAMCVYDP